MDATAPLPATRAVCADHSRYQSGCAGCARQGNRYNYVRDRDAAAGKPRCVPDLGTRRRLQGLARDGWSLVDLEPHMGVPGSNISRWRSGNPSGLVRAVNADRVRVVFDKLAGTIARVPASADAGEGGGLGPVPGVG